MLLLSEAFVKYFITVAMHTGPGPCIESSTEERQQEGRVHMMNWEYTLHDAPLLLNGNSRGLLPPVPLDLE